MNASALNLNRNLTLNPFRAGTGAGEIKITSKIMIKKEAGNAVRQHSRSKTLQHRDNSLSEFIHPQPMKKPMNTTMTFALERRSPIRRGGNNNVKHAGSETGAPLVGRTFLSAGSGDFPVARSSEHRTGKSGEPADRNVRPTMLAALLLCVLALMPLGLHAATNDLSTALQTGLFEEEANRNLPAAIAAYEKVAKQFDQNRALAATAIFRLGEVNRKLGKTNEAAAFYQRILREFTDQDTLAKLSQQNLAGMGMGGERLSERLTAVVSRGASVSNEAAQLAQQIAAIEELKGNPEKQARTVQAMFPDDDLKKMLLHLPKLQNQEAAFKANALTNRGGFTVALTASGGREVIQDLILSGGRLPGLPESQAELAKQLQYISERVSFILGLQKERLQFQQSLAAGGASESVSKAPITAVLDEEEAEIRRIQAMIQNSPDLINAPGDGLVAVTPLCNAAGFGRLRVVRFLLDNGAMVNAKSPAPNTSLRNGTALHYAANAGHRAMVELLLQRGADVNARDAEQQTALFIVADKGFRGVAEALIAGKADVNLGDKLAQTPLRAAVNRGHSAMVTFLLAQGVDVNMADSNGQTPLMCAARLGHVEVLKSLLAAKADINLESKDGRTALSYAAGNGHLDSVMALLEAKADPNVGKVNLPLHCAIAIKSAGIVEALLKAGADVNRVCKLTWRGSSVQLTTYDSEVPPLAVATDNVQLDIIKLLLAHKADPNGKRVDGSPLIFSAVNNAEIMKAFLDAGAKPNVNVGLNTPLNVSRAPKVISLLLAAGADPEVNLPLIVSVEGDHLQVAEALLKGGANVNATISGNGKTSLHIATERKNSEMIALLIAHKADVNARDKQGLTPLDYAAGKYQPGSPSRGSTSFTDRLRTLVAEADPSASASATSTASPVADLLRQHGGLADLPKLDRIEVTRTGTGYRTTAFLGGTNGWNQFTLVEVLGQQWGLLSAKRSGRWDRQENTFRNTVWQSNPLRFPDLSRIKIHSPAKGGGTRSTLNADLTIRDEQTGSFRNAALQMGDVVEVPEADHPVNEYWQGLAEPDFHALSNAIVRTVSITVSAKSTNLTLVPMILQKGPDGSGWIDLVTPSFMLRSVLDESKLIRSSSDLTRVKVTRRESTNAKPRVWVVDCSVPDKAPDLWLRDGDVIEIAEKAPSIFDTDPAKARAGGKVLLSGAVKASTLTLEIGKTTSVLAAVIQIGITDFGNLKKVELQRADPSTKQTSKIILDLETMKQGDRSQDVLLQDGDLILVPKRNFIL